MILADLGAEVIEVARPGHEASVRDPLRRGKRSVVLDLKRAGEVGLRLAASAQVLIEGFRPGVAERLGLGPEDCLGVNPALVYGRMTGYGQDGPLAGEAGHDIDYIALSGALASIGTTEMPVPPLNLVGDFGGGSMLLVIGVLAALRHAEATGQGQVVDAAMVEGSALLMAMHHGGMADGWWRPERGTNLFDGSAPFYTTYRTADDEWVAVGALEPHFYESLLDGLGLDAADLPAQMDRSGWPALRERFARIFRTRSRAEWEEMFHGSDACVVGVYSVSEAPEHPHNRARGTFLRRNGRIEPAPAPRFSVSSTTAGEIRESGADTADVLADLGLDRSEISRLEAEGVI